MKKYFNSSYVRPTSCYVEGDFEELMNNVLRKRVHGPLRPDKLFRFHYEALLGQTLIAASLLSEYRLKNLPITKNNVTVKNWNANMLCSTSTSKSNSRLPVIQNNKDVNITQIYNSDFSEISEISQNKDLEEDVFLTQNCIASDSDLNLNEIWRNKGEKDDVFLSRCINDTKSSQEITTRKPSSYFRPYPDYKSLHNAVVGAKKVYTAKKLLLTNGNLFRKHIVINNQSTVDSR